MTGEDLALVGLAVDDPGNRLDVGPEHRRSDEDVTFLALGHALNVTLYDKLV
jgi:hypothetical protein